MMKRKLLMDMGVVYGFMDLPLQETQISGADPLVLMGKRLSFTDDPIS